MLKKMIIGAISLTAAFLSTAGENRALACLSTHGCVISTFRDDYNMKRDGRMEKAMAAGRENIDAFRAMQNGHQAGPSRTR